MSFLKVEGLNKSFGGLKAVHNLDFDVEEGEIIGFIGPNGSGKTTTMNLLTGFLKHDSGKIVFRGKDIASLPRSEICGKGVARTFQINKPFLEFTALQNVVVGRVYGHQPARNMKTAAEEAREILQQVGLSAKAGVLSKDLTLMERKRLELARALAVRPYMLILDELMAGLNHAEAEDAMNLIRQTIHRQANRFHFQERAQREDFQQIPGCQAGDNIAYTRQRFEQVFVRQQQQGLTGGGFTGFVFLRQFGLVQDFAGLDFTGNDGLFQDFVDLEFFGGVLGHGIFPGMIYNML